MEQHEEGNSSFRFMMYDVSVGEGRASETSRIVAAIRDPRVEVGTYHHGFHLGIAKDQKRE